MPNMQDNPLAHLVLDDEEQQLEAALERGAFEEDAADFNRTKHMLEAAAKQHHKLNTTKPVTLRINQLDLIKIKAKAKRNNIPYQTLLGAVVHEFADSKKNLKLR